jgi:hypothetical protein
MTSIIGVARSSTGAPTSFAEPPRSVAGFPALWVIGLDWQVFHGLTGVVVRDYTQALVNNPSIKESGYHAEF